jgi:probable phosphoglycerate mutase
MQALLRTRRGRALIPCRKGAKLLPRPESRLHLGRTMPHHALLLLIRHGAVPCGDEVLWGRQEARLNAEGHRSITALAQALASAPVQVGTIVASPRARTLESAGLLAHALRRPCMTDAGFDEFHYGSWSARPFTALAADPRWQAFNRCRHDGLRAPQGEAVSAFRRRVRRALDARLRASAAPLVVVTHAEVIRAIVLDSMDRTLEDWRLVSVPPASLTILRGGRRHLEPVACGLTAGAAGAALVAACKRGPEMPGACRL